MSEFDGVKQHIIQANSVADGLGDTTSSTWDAMMRTELNRLDLGLDGPFDQAREYLIVEVEDRLSVPLGAETSSYEAVHEHALAAKALLTPAARSIVRGKPLREQYLDAMVKDSHRMVGEHSLELVKAHDLIDGLKYPEQLHKRRSEQIERLRIIAHQGLKICTEKSMRKFLFKLSARQFLEI